MKTRMQPIGNAWQKLPRIIRDLSRELGKKIELEMNGADTELDPSRITKLIDKEFVWFDPQRGFCTDADNLKQSGIDKAFPYIFAAAMTAMSFGAGREN